MWSIQKSPQYNKTLMADQDRKYQNDQFTLFAWMWAIAILLHYSTSSTEIWDKWLHFDPVHTPLIAIICIFAAIVVFYPKSQRALLALTIAFVIETWISLPWVADHFFMEFLFCIGLLATWIYQAAKNKTFQLNRGEVFETVAPLGRWLLIIMYFYGTFHKFNDVFLDPEQSCAVVMFNGLPFPFDVSDSVFFAYLAIYGTLVLEAVAMILLLIPRYKYYGMLMGMSFHFLVGITSYGTISHFSSLCFALHILFISPDALSRLRQYIGDRKYIYTRILPIITGSGIFLSFIFARYALWTATNTLWAVYGILIMLFVAKFGNQQLDKYPKTYLISKNAVVNTLSLFFFLQCLSPYIGLKTNTSIAMFSGLKTENGNINHVVFDQPVYLFDYQKNIATIIESNVPSIKGHRDSNLGMVYFELLRYFNEFPNASFVTYTRDNDNNRVYVLEKTDGIVEYRNFLEYLESKFVSFKPVILAEKPGCTH
jgi:hypothetical protein